MLKLHRFVPFLGLLLVVMACSRGTPAAPVASPMPTTAAQPTAPTAPSMPTLDAQPIAQPAVSSATSSFDPRALDTAGMEECTLLADTDFSARLGQTPADQAPEAEVNRVACYYNFSSGQTIYVTILTGQPGKEAYDSRMQYLDSAAGTEALPLGEIAVLQERDGLISIQAVVNGWYLAVDGRGFDRQAVIALAQLFEARLIPYPQQVVEPTAPIVGQCQNLYYPVVQDASWQYQLSGVTSDTFTRVIPAVRADGFTDQDTFGTGTIRTANWACEKGNLIALTPTGGPTVNAAGVQFDFTVESNDGITFPADPQPGQMWAQNIVYLGQQNAGDTKIQSRNVLENSCKAGNIERVNVPAGEFQALRVDCSTKIDIYISGALAFTLNSTSAAWHAPGVGLIKSSGTSDMGPTEIVLLAYSIP